MRIFVFLSTSIFSILHAEFICKRGIIKKMNYVNFETAITAKFGIVLENWPVPKFQSPTNMLHTEAEICFRSWESGATRFRMLTNDEWAVWLNGRYAAPSVDEPTAPAADSEASRTPTTPIAVSASTTSPTMPPIDIPTAATLNTPNASTTPTPETEVHASAHSTPATAEKRLALESNVMAPPAKCAHVESTTLNFVHSVTPAVGAAFVVPKATRKKRSDAGVARGPRKQRTPPTSENTAPSETTSTIAASKPRARKKATAQVATAPAASPPSSLP